MAQNLTLQTIADAIGKNISTVSREIQRHSTLIRNCKYRANRVQLKSDEQKKYIMKEYD